MLGLVSLVSAAYFDVRPVRHAHAHAVARRASWPLVMQDSGDGDDPLGEAVGDEERGEVADFRAQLMRQMLGDANAEDGAAMDTPPAPGEDTPRVEQATSLAAGQILVANPERFCSRNPFARPVRDLSRFGLQGPIGNEEGLSADMKAQMLPVLVLLEHSAGGGSRALLMERRTGALMGDVAMDDYGPCAISPLWLGGTAKQNSLYVVHDVSGLEGATEIADGLYLGGWDAARPQVADSSLAEGRFKFFLGATEWQAGQLEDEVKNGAWLALDVPPTLVIKDRVMGWRPGKPKPVWTELMNLLHASDDDKAQRLIDQVYPPNN